MMLTRIKSTLLFALLLVAGSVSLGASTGFTLPLDAYGQPDFAPAASKEFHPPLALADVCETDNTVFLAGERLTYKLYYNWGLVWLSAGEVVFQVNDLPNQFHITVTGKTYESYEWFYKVHDRYESYISKKTLLPELHIKDVHQGSYMRYDRTRFNNKTHIATSDRGKTRDDTKRKTVPYEGCMHDMVSMVYWARNLDYANMRLGQEFPIDILMDQEVYPLKIKYLGKEESTTVKGVGEFRTRRFTPQLIAGDVFKEGDEMQIYVSDDENKLPVLIESPVIVGSVKAVLQSYKGLKYPLTAKLD